jgi:hypothetical protein
LIDRVFAAQDRQKSLAIIDEYATIWERVVGTRGFTGKRATNAHTMFNSLFEVDDEELPSEEFDESLLEQLENQNNG